jgi:small-conductance mechanosensitive channel
MVFAALAYVRLASILFFAVLLPRVRLRTPHILQEIIGGGASVIAVLALASSAGFNLSGLIATSAVLTAVVGLSFQDTLGNIMAGVALQMDRSVQVGDWIQVGETAGRVTEVRWRSTRIETRNWETVVIPNSVLLRNQFVILGRRIGAPAQWRRWIHFNVDFRTPPNEVISVVEAALRSGAMANVSADPPPNCILLSMQESYGRYAARYWLTDLLADDPTDSQVRTRIYFALKRAGIPLSIPAQAVFVTEETKERRERKEKVDAERRREALARVDFFAPLSDADRARLAAGLRHAPFAPGETMTRQGAQAHWLYLILDGEAAVRVTGEGGLEREVAQLGPGSFFGEMSLMTGAPRSATVVATTDVECYRLDKAAFQEILAERPELAERVAEILARRQGELSEVRESLDAVARDSRLMAAKRDLLGRIRDFFGLAGAGDD